MAIYHCLDSILVSVIPTAHRAGPRDALSEPVALWAAGGPVRANGHIGISDRTQVNPEIPAN